MGITKAKKAKKYKKRIKFWGGGSYSDSRDDPGGSNQSSSSSSNDNDSGSSYDYAPQQFTPAPTPTYVDSVDDPSRDTIDPTQTFADDDYTLTPEETKEQQDTISSSIDDLKNTIEDDGTSLYTTTPDYTYDEKKGIYNAPTFQGPYVDSRNDPFTTAKNTDTGFFDSGIGKFIKNIGKGALLFAAPAIGGLAFGKKGYDLVNLGMKGKRAYDFAKRISPTTTGKVKDALTKNINFTPGSGGTKPPTGFNDNDNNEGNALVAKNVIAKSVQEYSPTQVKSLQNNINLLSSVMDKGQYQGIQLSSSQLSQISNQRNSLIEQYKTIQESLV